MMKLEIVRLEKVLDYSENHFFMVGNKYVVETEGMVQDVDTIVSDIVFQLRSEKLYNTIQLLSVRIDNRFFTYDVTLDIKKPIKCERITSIL